MTEQANDQTELDALREDVLDALRERMREAGRHVASAHNLVADVFDESLEVSFWTRWKSVSMA